MTNDSLIPHQRPPEDFLEQVKSALESLYDFPALNRHPLALTAPVGQASEPQGQRLRRELITAIEALSPGKDVAARSNAARTYNLLHMHYVGGVALQEVANHLGISLRQAYRDLRYGYEGVAELLWFNRQQAEQDAAQVSSVQSELARLEGNTSPTDMRALLSAALSAVQRLTEQQAVQLEVHLPEHPVVLSSNPLAAQQVFIALLSRAIQHAQVGVLYASLHPDKDASAWLFELRFNPREANEFALPAPILTFIKQLRFQFLQNQSPDQLYLSLRLPAHGATILMIDDNQGLLDLLQRFLPEPRYRVIAANNGIEGLRYAQTLQPDAILLDLMMPDMNGWDLLQRLRADARTQAIPVVICSVVSDPELAYSLGATQVIPKPITRESLLAVLQELGL